MWCRNILFLLAFATAVCFAYENGVVEDVSHSGKFEYVFTKQENDKAPLVDFWIQQDSKNLLRFSCNLYQINANTEHHIDQFRTILTTPYDAELEDFRVTECKKELLEAAIKVTQTSDAEYAKEYLIYFKDDKGQVRKREYTVEISPNIIAPLIGIKRSEADIIQISRFRNNGPIDKKVTGVVMSWYDDGKLSDIAFPPEGYTTTYPFGCDMCWVLCKEPNKGDKYVDILLGNTPVDRLKVTTCSKISLKISIKFDLYIEKGTGRNHAVYMNYLKPNNQCIQRLYKYDVLEHEDRMLQRSSVEREDPKENRDCKTAKVQGYLRNFGLRVLRRFGRTTVQVDNANSDD